MGAVVGLLGIGGGAGGTNFAGPQAASLTTPVTPGQLDQSYGSTLGSLGQQQALLAALQQQGGIQNQSQVYRQLQDVAAGRGPNPAQALLNQQTAQNVQNQAALMAGQRGASSNVGLIARQIAQMGAQTQQQAAGQAASMQAQQQLGALGAAGSIAGTQAQEQVAQTNQATASQLQQQQMLQQALQAQNQQAIQNQASINAANAGMATAQVNQQGNVASAVLDSGSNAASSGAGAAALAGGGEVKQKHTPSSNAETQVLLDPDSLDKTGRRVQFHSPTSIETTDGRGRVSDFDPKNLTPDQEASIPMTAGPEPLTYQKVTGAPDEAPATKPTPRSSVGKILASVFAASTAPAASSDAPVTDTRGQLLKALGGDADVGSKLKQGGHVPGKAKVGGAVDSYKNDTVKAKLSPGEIVIPRSVTQSKDPVGESAKFVAAVLAKKKGRS